MKARRRRLLDRNPQDANADGSPSTPNIVVAPLEVDDEENLLSSSPGKLKRRKRRRRFLFQGVRFFLWDFYRSRQKTPLLLLALATTAICFAWFKSNANLVDHSYQPAEKSALLPFLASTSLSTLDAIVTVATCGFDATPMVNALRQDGQWDKPIYILTDNPQAYFALEQGDSLEPILISVRNRHPTFANAAEREEYQRGIQQFNPEIWSKWHKTQIFDYIIPTNPHIQYILFMDADILAQKPLAESFLPAVQDHLDNPDCQWIMYQERWYTNLPLIGSQTKALTGRYNSGMWIAKRSKYTQSILDEWSRRLVHPPWMGRDQGKLTQAFDAIATEDNKICPMPSRFDHMHNRADVLDLMWFSWWKRQAATFFHYSSRKGGQWKTMLHEKCEFSSDIVVRDTSSQEEETSGDGTSSSSA